MALLAHLDPHYRLIAEVMVLTGMIASEIAGLRRSDIGETHIEIQHAKVRGQSKDELKTPFRRRRIPITQALRERLDTVLVKPEGQALFTMKSGREFLEGSFRQNPWTRAFEKAGLDYKVPYTMRHTFAAWSLTIGIDPNRLVNLMGHGSKQMVYEVYGEYVEGLEQDRQKILVSISAGTFWAAKTNATPSREGQNGESLAKVATCGLSSDRFYDLLDGGGGGNRTRVRKFFTTSFYMLSPRFD